MLNCITVICFVAVVLVANVSAEEGFTSRCDFNHSLFVPKGNNATFTADIKYDFHIIDFQRGISRPRMLLTAFIFGLDDFDILYIDIRINVSINDERITITLQDVIQDDHGMFVLKGGSDDYCWELFVLDIWNPQNIATFEENLPAYIDATPPASSMVRPRVNASATWLLDGLVVSQTTNFMEQDGRMIIMRMSRHLNAKNVTYRITEDNGRVHNVNLTMWVLYGPYSPLQFSPSRTSYIVTSRDVLPDITCSTDCNPPCEIVWDRSGIRNVLSLRKVDKTSKGMYTCTATRNGTDRVVERSLYVEVNDGPYSPLQFSPSKTSYIVTSGDVLPDITCSTDCNPPCEITWDRSGVRNVLSLGKVDKSSKGMYTCMVTRSGTDRVVERSLFVEVNDETSFIAAVTILGTLQGVTLIFIFVFTVYWLRTSERKCSCLKGTGKTDDRMQDRTKTQHVHETDISTIEMEHYEGLDSSRNTEPDSQDAYENLKLDTVANSV